MKRYVYSLRIYLVAALLCLGSVELIAQSLMPLPAQSTTYTGNTRGYYFQSPVDFMMVGVRVPTTASVDDQSVAVVRFNSGPPPFWATTTNDFTVLALFQDIPGSNVLSVQLPIYIGDHIGILGSRGASSTNSYGQGNFSTNILGSPVTLARMGMQYDLETVNPQNIWQENSSISRVEMYYTELIINEYPWCEGFESTNGSFSTAGTFVSWEYGAPSNTVISGAASGSNAWVTNLDGDYNNNELSFCQSPEFDLSPLTDPVVKLMVNHDIESGWDGVSFQASTDNGLSWSTIGSAASPAPWYNGGSINGLSSLNSDDGWTGSTSGWEAMEHSLSTYANDTSVLFRMVMGSDGSVIEEGFGFDDMIVAESNDVAITEVMYADSACGETESNIDAVLCNISVEDKFGFDVLVDTNGNSFTYTYPDTLSVCGCDTVTVATINTSNGGYWTFDLEIDNSGDVNAANDTASGDILSYAIPGGEIVSGEGTYCEGDAIQLTFEFTGVAPFNFSFSNGVSGNTVNGASSPYSTFVTQGGDYEIFSLTDSSGCAGDSGTFGGIEEVIVTPNPTPDLGPDTTVCGAYQIDAGPGTSYSWNTGATSQTLDIIEPGLYAVTVTDANGCVGSDEADLFVNPLPIVTINDTVLCEDGTVLFNAGGPFQAYIWDDGSTAPIRSVNSLTTVSVTVTDFNNCVNDKSATVTEEVSNPNPTVTSFEGYSPVTLDAGAGYIGYYWNTGQTTQTIQVGAAGSYTCTVTDNNGCKGSDQAGTKIWPLSVDEEVAQSGVAIYPNPAKEQLSILFGQKVEVPQNALLYDINGAVVGSFILDQGASRSDVTLPKGLASGSYFIRLDLGDQQKDLPLIIMD